MAATRCCDCGRKKRGEDWGWGSGGPMCPQCHDDAAQEFKDRNNRVGVNPIAGTEYFTVSAPPKYVLSPDEWGEFGYRAPRNHRIDE